MSCEAHGPVCTPEWIEHWGEFLRTMEDRFKEGHEKYGDDPGTFNRPIDELLAEMREESEDIIGWGFAVRVRLKHLEQMAKRIEEVICIEDVLKLTANAPIPMGDAREFAALMLKEHFPSE